MNSWWNRLTPAPRGRLCRLMAFPRFSWLSLWFPEVNESLRNLAAFLHLQNIPMAYTSEQTVALLKQTVTTLRSSRETTAAAITAREAAIKELEAALAIVEPLKAENSALQSLAQNLEGQLEANTLELNDWKVQDQAEDAALAEVDAFLNPVDPPVDPEVPAPPVDGDGNPLPPADPTQPALPVEDGVDLTVEKTESDPL